MLVWKTRSVAGEWWSGIEAMERVGEGVVEGGIVWGRGGRWVWRWRRVVVWCCVVVWVL